MTTEPCDHIAGPEEISAGPLSLLFENGYVRSLRYHGIEVIRRIYMALRDEYWNVIPGTLSDIKIALPAESENPQTGITFNSRHIKNDIDYTWHGEITAHESGELSFVMDGTALSNFRQNRIGFCVLHPLDSCKGTPCRIETVDGNTRESLFPDHIAPWPVFTGIKSMTWPIFGKNLTVTVLFDGDSFETEDQRNWTDASYKTYSCSVQQPLPLIVEKGTAVRQKVTVKVEVAGHVVVKPAVALTVEIDDRAKRSPFPLIGTTVSNSSVEEKKLLDPALSLQAFDFLRTDFYPGSDSLGQQLDFAGRMYRRHRIPFEAALFLGEDPVAEAERLAALLADADFPLSRFLVFRKGEPSTSAETIRAVGEVLRRAAPSAGMYSGSDGWFVEINRKKPDLDLIDGICFSASPQVHTFDDCAIMENLEGLAEVIREANFLAGDKKIVLSPLTLRPRKFTHKPHKDGGPDGRMKQHFGAAWLAGVLSRCVGSGLSSLTISSVDELFDFTHAGKAVASPAMTLLHKLLEERKPVGGAITGAKLRSSDESAVCGFEAQIQGHRILCFANLTGESQHIKIWNTSVHISPYSVRKIEM